MINIDNLPFYEKLYFSKQMRQFDSKSIDKYLTPSILLMGNAGAALAQECLCVSGFFNKSCNTDPAAFLKNVSKLKVLVVSGKGNNGGDGAAAACWLKSRGADVRIFLASHIKDITPDSRVFMESAQKQDVPVIQLSGNEKTFFKKLSDSFGNYSIVLDCLLGTGIKGKVRGVYRQLIQSINSAAVNYKLKVISADVPSGVDSDTGFAGSVSAYSSSGSSEPVSSEPVSSESVYNASGDKMPVINADAVNADVTITFQTGKPGLYIWPGMGFAGNVKTVPISLACEAAPKAHIFRPTLSAVSSVFKKRQKNFNKGDCGKAAVIGGSYQYPGAVRLASLSALRAGPGYVLALMPPEVHSGFSGFLPEVVAPFLKEFSFEALKEYIKPCKAIGLGPGMGVSDNTASIVKGLISGYSGSLVLDADALNVMAENRCGFFNYTCLRGDFMKGNFLITPHPGEFARLFKIDKALVLSDPLKFVLESARKTGVNILLKGVSDILASPEGMCAIIDQGHQCLARAGSGDMLTGLITALAARGYTLFDAAWTGSWILKRASVLASVKGSGEALMVSSLASEYENIFQEILEFGNEVQV
jgi:NAD(P)H-hydrate epimerase